MLAHALGLIGILVGTATDIHHREVPDWVNYTLITAGVGIGTSTSLASSSWDALIASGLGLTAGYLVGALMYYTGQWGGGDSKMIMGLGALLGVPLDYVLGAGQTPLLVYFLIATIFAGAAYGMAWMAVLLVTKRETVLPALKKKLRNRVLVRLRIAGMVAAALAAAAAVAWFNIYTLLLVFVLFISLLTLYFALAVKAIEQTCFIKQQPVKDLVVGDWVVEEVEKDGEVLVPESNTGITPEQIAALADAGVKHVTIKEGIPFVPSFLAAYIAAYIWWQSSAGLLFWL